MNVLTKKRENYYEIYKHKTSVISQSLPVYGKLGSYYSELSDHLSNLKDVERTIFCACKILHYEDLIFEKYGTIQLDNLEAEEIITNLVLSVPIQVNGQLINLVRKMPAYVDFRKYLQDNPPLLDTFKKFFRVFRKKRGLWKRLIESVSA